MEPYDLCNTVLSSAMKQQVTEVELFSNESPRSSDRTEDWTTSHDYGNSEFQMAAFQSTSSFGIGIQEGNCEDEPNSNYESLVSNHEVCPFFSRREDVAVKRNLSHYLLLGNEGALQSEQGLSVPTKGDALAAKEWAMESSKLASNFSQAQSRGLSFQSCDILTLNRNMNKACRHNLQKAALDEEAQSRERTLDMIIKGRTDELCKEPKPKKLLTGDVTNMNDPLKRQKLGELSSQNFVPSKPGEKGKLGDRITALQQLVSPFGKTDTASVLLEAIGYINFLQDQVQVLSSPYLKPTSGGQDQGKDTEAGYELRNRGLCLVPVSCTVHVANSNGADYWTSAIGSGCSRS